MTTHVNRTHLTGNLGSDPESRVSATGTRIVTASIAVHSSYTQGETWKERTDWFRLVAFGEAGEALGRFGKGERIAITGRLQSSEYTDREGQRRTSVEVVVLRSAPAPLPRKAAAEVEVEVEAEPAAEASQPRRRSRSPAGAARSPPSPPTAGGAPQPGHPASACAARPGPITAVALRASVSSPPTAPGVGPRVPAAARWATPPAGWCNAAHRQERIVHFSLALYRKVLSSQG